MKSWKEIKSEGNQGVKNEGSTGRQKTLNEREMGSGDKEVQKKPRGGATLQKRLRIICILGVFFCLHGNHCSLKADTSPYSKWHQSWMSDLDKLGCRSKEETLQTEERAADSGESTAGQRYNCNWLLYSPFPNLQPQGATSGEREQRARTDCHNSEILCDHESRISD